MVSGGKWIKFMQTSGVIYEPIGGVHAVLHHAANISLASSRVISLWVKWVNGVLMEFPCLSNTFKALVPAYCLLITSPLLAQSRRKADFSLSGIGACGIERPNLTSWDTRTALAMAVWTTLVRSRQSMQFTRNTDIWLQSIPCWSRQWKPMAPVSGPTASIRADTFSKRIPRLKWKDVIWCW